MSLTSLAFSANPFVKDGNIFIEQEGGEEIQLTKSGKDKNPVLSPDGKKVAFTRKSNKEAFLSVGGKEDYLKNGPGAILADQLFRRVPGTRGTG